MVTRDGIDAIVNELFEQAQILSDLQMADRLIEAYAQEFDVEINVQFYGDGYRCTVWTSETYDGDNSVLLCRDDLPAAESALAAVRAWGAALRERSKAYDRSRADGTP